MAKLTRAVQKTFGENANSGEIKQIGSLAASAPLTTTDISTLQALSNYLDGLFGIVLGGNSPAIEDFNGLFFLITRQLKYLYQQGLPEWETNTVYYTGSMVNVAGIIYISTADDNQGNAITDTTKWKTFNNNGSYVLKSGNATLLIGETFAEVNAAAVITLPSGASPGYEVTVKNTSAAGVVSVIFAGGIDGGTEDDLSSQYQSSTYVFNGTEYLIK